MNPEQFKTKKIAVLVTLFLAIILGFWLLFWVFTHGRLSISVQSKTTSVEIYNQNSGEQVYNTVSTDQQIYKTLSSGDYEIRLFSSDGRSSAYFVNIPRWLGKKSIPAELLNQHGRSKLARNTERCLLYSRDKLYSHNCYGSSKLFSHTPTKYNGFSKKAESRIGPTLSVKQYKEDLIALFINEDENGSVKIAPSLALISNGEIVKTINLPPDFYSENTAYTLVIDKKSTKVAVARDGNVDILIFNDLDSKPGRIKPNIETTINIEFLESTLDISDGKLYLFVGKPSNSGDSADEAIELKQKQDTIISIFDLVSLRKEYEIKTSEPNDNATKCAPTIICFLSDGQLSLLRIDSKSALPLLKVSGVSEYDYNSAGNIYYIRDNSLNILDINSMSSRLIFKSNKFIPSNIAVSKSGILLNTFTLNENNISHAFLLDDKPGGDNFIDNHLPYERGKFGIVQDSDFSNSIFLVKLALTSWESDAEGSTNFHYNTSEFIAKRNTIKKYFEKEKINKKIKLVVIP